MRLSKADFASTSWSSRTLSFLMNRAPGQDDCRDTARLSFMLPGHCRGSRSLLSQRFFEGGYPSTVHIAVGLLPYLATECNAKNAPAEAFAARHAAKRKSQNKRRRKSTAWSLEIHRLMEPRNALLIESQDSKSDRNECCPIVVRAVELHR